MPTTIPYDILIEQDRRDPQAAAYMDEQGALMDAAVELMLLHVMCSDVSSVHVA